MQRTLLVTIDSLRYDHLDAMPATQRAMDDWHESAYSTAPNTPGSAPAFMSGELPDEPGVDRTIANLDRRERPAIGITANRLLSGRYGYDSGFDHFSAPELGTDPDSIATRVGARMRTGSFAYRLASALYSTYQTVSETVGGLSRSFRPAGDMIDEFLEAVDGLEQWLGWLHVMEPHHPYEPDSSRSRARAQKISRKVIHGHPDDEAESAARRLYREEVTELDSELARLWREIPNDARVVVTSDHGELLGEGGRWGHPGVNEGQNELYHVPFGHQNAPAALGEYVSLLDVPSILFGREVGEGQLTRDRKPTFRRRVSSGKLVEEDLAALGYLEA